MAKAELNFGELGGVSNAEMVTAEISNGGKTITASWSIDAKCAILMHHLANQNQIWVVNLQDYSWWIAYVPSPYTSGGAFQKQSTGINVGNIWTSDSHGLSHTNATNVFTSAIVIALTELPPAFFS